MTGFSLALSVGGAGAAGAVARYLIDLEITRHFPRTVPRGTITVNIIGSLIFGLLTGLIAHHHLAANVGVIFGTGFCGGLTTFSSSTFETARLLHEHEHGPAVAVITVGIGTACLAAACGLGLALL